MDGAEEFTTQDSTVEDWTRALAESTGSPGGGAGTGLMLAIAAALASMVAGYTEADGHGELARLRARARSLRQDALRLADRDVSASRAFGAAFRLEPGPKREAAISRASLDAARASALLGRRAIGAVGDLAWLAAHGNRALVPPSDRGRVAAPCGPRWPCAHQRQLRSRCAHLRRQHRGSRFANGIRTSGRWLASSTAQSIGSTA